MRDGARLRALVVLLALVMLSATQRTTAALAADGLPPGVPVPSWAKGKKVHFDPAEPQNPRLAGGNPTAVVDTGTRPLELSAESLKYEGGPVENEPRLVLIFLGEEWEGALALRHELEATAEGLPGSGFQKILTQYSSIDGPISPGPLIDSPVVEKYYLKQPIAGKVGRTALTNAVTEVRRLAGGPERDPNTTYAVMPAPGTAEMEANTCGYHVSLPGSEASLAAIMDTEGRFGCGSPSMTLTHEYAESVTDPTQEGWRRSDSGENEIADVCKYLGPQRMADGAWVTAIWDDAKNACEVEDSDPGSVPIGPYTEPIHTETSLYGSTNQSLESETFETALYPCGLEADYYFEYGTSKAYGSKTAEVNVPARWGEVQVNTTVTGLKYSTHYHWRLVVKTSNGTAYGGDHEFVIPYYVEVKEDEVSNVGITEATLESEVLPAGVEAKYYFEYGPTEAYGSRTAEASAGSGTTYEKVSATLAGLAVGTLYHFRIVASSSRGTTVGEDRAFWTNGGKPLVETRPVEEIGYTGAALAAVINSKGTATIFYFEYGKTDAYGLRTAERLTEGSGSEERYATLAGLEPDATYHFRIVATNSYGTSYGDDEEFSTRQEPLVETEAPTTIGYNDATLSGAIDPYGTAISYYFEYGTSQTYGKRTARSTAGSGTSVVQEAQTVSGLAEGTTYHFRMVATNSYATIYGADRTFSTGTQPLVQTNAPANVGSTSAMLSGTINPHGTEVGYYFEYGVAPEYGSITAQTGTGAGYSDVEASQTIAELLPDATYHYRLVAVYDSVKQYGSEVTFTTAALLPLVKTLGLGPVPNETPPPPASHKTPSPLLVQNARQSTTRWREGNRLARISRAKAPTGTTFSFSLNKQARVSFSFTQLLGVPRVAHSCLARAHKNIKGTVCDTAAAGALSFAGHSGTNKVIFAGRMSHTSKLKPGQYELTITATNSTGQRSTPVSLIFTIAK
jgi:hypothetical protein